MKFTHYFFILFLFVGCGDEVVEETVESYTEESPKIIHIVTGEGEKKNILQKIFLKENGDTNSIHYGDSLITKFDYFETDTLKSISNFLHNEKSGEWKIFHDNGKVDCIMHFNKNIIDSTYKEFYSNGKKAIVGFYKDGIREDNWKFFDSDGNLIGDCKYLKGDIYYSSGGCYVTNYAD